MKKYYREICIFFAGAVTALLIVIMITPRYEFRSGPQDGWTVFDKWTGKGGALFNCWPAPSENIESRIQDRIQQDQ